MSVALPPRTRPGPGDRLLPLWVGLAAWAWCMPRLASVPGTHSDEAWLLHMVEGVRHGAPAQGMNFYTGALHVRLLAPVAGMLGNTVGTARLLGVSCNALALALLVDVLRGLLGRERALWAAALLASSATFVFMARNAIEVHMLGPLLAVGALWCWTRGSRSAGPGWFVTGGALLGLLVHNHASAVGVPVGLVLAAGWLARRDRAVLRRLMLVVAGALVALLPRLVDAALHLDTWMQRGGLEVASPWWTDVPYLPGFVLAAWSGSFFLERVAGPPGLWWWGGPLWGLVPLAALLLRHRDVARRAPSPVFHVAVLAWVATVAVTLPLTRWLSASYLCVPLWLLPVVPAVLAAPLWETPARWAARAVLALWCGANVMTVVVDYHQAFAQTGGVVHAFPVGARLVESSAHMVRVDGLYQALLDKGLTTVVADPFIGGALAGPDVGAGRLNLVRWDAMNPPPSDAAWLRGDVVLLYYRGPNIRTSVDYSPGDAPLLGQGPMVWRRIPELDPHFVAYTPLPAAGGP